MPKAPVDATRPGGVLPAALRPTMREVPALAWTAAHALSSLPTGHRGGLLLGAYLRPIAALWAIPMWVIVWIPAIGLTTHRGEVARRSRRALVLALASIFHATVVAVRSSAISSGQGIRLLLGMGTDRLLPVGGVQVLGSSGRGGGFRLAGVRRGAGRRLSRGLWPRASRGRVAGVGDGCCG